jgi:hypothetical protein
VIFEWAYTVMVGRWVRSYNVHVCVAAGPPWVESIYGGKQKGAGNAFLFRCCQRASIGRPLGLDCRNEQEAIKAGEAIAWQIAEDASPKAIRHVVILNSDRERDAKIASNGRDCSAGRF